MAPGNRKESPEPGLSSKTFVALARASLPPPRPQDLRPCGEETIFTASRPVSVNLSDLRYDCFGPSAAATGSGV